MPIADKRVFLADLTGVLKAHWPDNRVVTIACHGHSVPAGYFATPMVDSFNAYPHRLHLALKRRFPYAVINVVVTAIGGENSVSGARRFKDDVLPFKPDVITIDYGLNDRGPGLKQAAETWASMINAAKAQGSRVILLTPTPDISETPEALAKGNAVRDHAAQIRRLADEYSTGLADSFAVFERHKAAGGDIQDLMSWVNHPNALGHELVARELLAWFPPY